MFFQKSLTLFTKYERLLRGNKNPLANMIQHRLFSDEIAPQVKFRQRL